MNAHQRQTNIDSPTSGIAVGKNCSRSGRKLVRISDNVDNWQAVGAISLSICINIHSVVEDGRSFRTDEVFTMLASGADW